MKTLAYANLFMCAVNLGMYALADPKPLSLAVGIFSGFVALFCLDK